MPCGAFHCDEGEVCVSEGVCKRYCTTPNDCTNTLGCLQEGYCDLCTHDNQCRNNGICDRYSGQCRDTCTSDADCIAKTFCQTGYGKCANLLPTDSPCERDRQCESGNCSRDFLSGISYCCKDALCCHSNCNSVAPTLSIELTKLTEFTLRWNNSVSGHTGYRLYKCTEEFCTPDTELTTVGPTELTYIDKLRLLEQCRVW